MYKRQAHHALFQVASIITTTGYSTVDFDKWPEFSKCIIVLLMFIGACAGSTGGGMKVSSIMIAFKEAKREISTMIHPRSVKVLTYEGKVIGNDTLRVLNCYIIVYFMLFVASVRIVSLDNYDLEVYKRQIWHRSRSMQQIVGKICQLSSVAAHVPIIRSLWQISLICFISEKVRQFTLSF